MANKTIYGCVNRTTGAITFAGEACDSGNYTGCIVRSGDHAGQVAVTINEANCDDTYYGCINRSTGEFQLVIPDDCCEIACPCEYLTLNTCGCYPDTEVPKYLLVTFSGVRSCEDDSLIAEVNQEFCMTYVATTIWESGLIYHNHKILYRPASTAYCGEDWGFLEIWDGTDIIFDAIYLADCSVVINNQQLYADCGGSKIGYGGTGTIVNPCD